MCHLNHFLRSSRAQSARSEASWGKKIYQSQKIDHITFLSMSCISNVFVKFLLRWHSQIWVEDGRRWSAQMHKFHFARSASLHGLRLVKQVMSRTWVVRYSALSKWHKDKKLENVHVTVKVKHFCWVICSLDCTKNSTRGYSRVFVVCAFWFDVQSIPTFPLHFWL